MRRTLFTLLAVVALAATVPAVALAFRGHGHARHHSKSAPTTPTASNAGTVTSFSNGQLTITESNGQTVTGTVSRFTRVRFHIQFTPPSSSAKRDRTASKRHFGHGGGFGGGGFGHHHHFGKPTPPTIQPGETVLDASLVLTSKGALWTALDLVAPAPTPPTTTTTTSTGPTPTTPTTTGPTPTTPTTTGPTPTTPTTASKRPGHRHPTH